MELSVKISALIILITGIVFTSCVEARQTSESQQNVTVVLKEAFHTVRDEGDNVDSPAIWHGDNGEHWLLATAKEGHAIVVYDATDGSYIKHYGSEGNGPGEFQRPNGIGLVDDLMLVVERDNQRIQVIRLPEFEVVGHFGDSGFEDNLIYPYGIAVDKVSEGTYEVYVTDNYNPYLQGYPAEGELDERIHHYRFTVSGNSLNADQINIFGEVYNAGALHKVESLWTDRHYNRLMIADEAYLKRDIKIYDLEGNFTGETIPNKYFTSEPEGIALYTCDDGSGYWIMTDQHKTPENKFEVFDRETLEHLGTFKGEITRNTDGIWLTQKAFGPFPKGAFYPVHDDGSVTAISWEEIADALSLDRDCTY
jgi:3-phytase